MTISQMQLEQEISEPEIRKFWLGYFQEDFRDEVHQLLVEMYEDVKTKNCLSRTDLAKKIGRRPEQITRWLLAPTNLELDTISDLALAMGVRPKMTLEPLQSRFAANNPNVSNPFSDHVKGIHSMAVTKSTVTMTQIDDKSFRMKDA